MGRLTKTQNADLLIHPAGKIRVGVLPELFVGGIQDVIPCHDEARLKKPSGRHGGGGSPPSAEDMAAHLRAHECADECVLKSQNLLTTDGELNKDAIKAQVVKSFTGDWAKLASDTADKCLASAKGEVTATATCKSGAGQFIYCFRRNLFLQCPSSSWTETTDCAAAKARITKCPNAKIPMGHHRH
uniref:Odorant-binding protein 31 n=1 Tax=Adelphocoris suturalis TaxID=323751 RepID=A0A166IGR9_9HEMI|nr:odorant-binding protein 31 [Adelphocoris suturalis]